jgi:hypothetical protein
MAFCAGAGIKLAGAAAGPEVGVVGEGNQGIVGDKGGDAVELDHCSANPNANPRIGGLIRTSDECYSPGREAAGERRRRFLASWRRDDEHDFWSGR